MFEYHDRKKQVEFLRSIRLESEGDKALMEDVIHDLEEPYQCYCLDEAAYRLNEVSGGLDGPDPSTDEVCRAADMLYNAEGYLDSDIAYSIATKVYKEAHGLSGKEGC